MPAALRHLPYRSLRLLPGCLANSRYREIHAVDAALPVSNIARLNDLPDEDVAEASNRRRECARWEACEARRLVISVPGVLVFRYRRSSTGRRAPRHSATVTRPPRHSGGHSGPFGRVTR